MIHANQVAALADAIGRVAPLAGPADATLSTFFRANPDMGMRDRAFVAVYDQLIVESCVRHEVTGDASGDRTKFAISHHGSSLRW